jgi:hypothetical protein
VARPGGHPTEELGVVVMTHTTAKIEPQLKAIVLSGWT